MPVRLNQQGGFTLPELLVVVLVIGVLSAIALPVFLGQQDKGRDSSAKSAARNLATAVETCDEGDYRDCDTQTELGSEGTSVPWGTGPGEVRVVAATAKDFEIEAVSLGRTGGAYNRFSWARDAGGDVSRSCTGSSGCRGGAW